MKIQIKHRYNGSILFETDAESLGAAVAAAMAAKANLSWANLSGANLSRANLSGANVPKKQLAVLVPRFSIVAQGDIVGWKKLQNGVVCKLLIPAKARRVGGVVGRKCRAEYAQVVSCAGKGLYDGTVYKVGETVKADKFDPNPLVECSHGIHFFITKLEAMEYSG